MTSIWPAITIWLITTTCHLLAGTSWSSTRSCFRSRPGSSSTPTSSLDFCPFWQWHQATSLSIGSTWRAPGSTCSACTATSGSTCRPSATSSARYISCSYSCRSTSRSSCSCACQTAWNYSTKTPSMRWNSRCERSSLRPLSMSSRMTRHQAEMAVKRRVSTLLPLHSWNSKKPRTRTMMRSGLERRRIVCF